METKLSIDAHTIRRYHDQDALAFVDLVLGSPDAWSRSLVAYRLTSDSEANWKMEVGCWLLLARDLGFLEALKVKLKRALKRAKKPSGDGPNDKAHLVLNQELAAAMAVYYFTAFGWRFDAWEPPRPNDDFDVDVRLAAPDGRLVDIQVKAPDQPGHVTNGGRVGDGEYDARVLAATNHALGQLKASPGPCRLVVISPQRMYCIGAETLRRHLVGFATSTDDGRSMVVDTPGLFAGANCTGISAVADLHLYRVGDVLYRCTVLLNPWCVESAALPVTAFPYSRVLSPSQYNLVWVPESPSR